MISAGLQAQTDQARQAGEKLDQTEPFAVNAGYEAADQLVFIKMKNGVLSGINHLK